MSNRYHAQDLRDFATRLMVGAGIDPDKAEVVAEILIEGDLYGHTTHGLQMLVPYLKSIDADGMTLSGDYEVLSDRGSNLLWDANYLPGPWVTVKAIEAAEEKAREHGIATVVIRRSHHIGCLQAYLKRVTDEGHFIILTCSDPSVTTVAPHGGLKALYTPNPFAVGIPTDGAPILIDISMSATTNGLTMRLNKQGKRLPHVWLKDAEGNATDDPSALFTEPPGTILPLGGVASGHKGFALGIMVEALTSALGGYGRADGADQWGASIFLQIIDPGAFGGREAFGRETKWFADACHETPVRDGDPPVRLPGEAGLRKREEQLANGVDLYPGILEALNRWVEKFNVPQPKPMG